MQYFYHPDHLGSASFVTDRDGAVCQHLQYLPFGELFVSQRNSEFDSRYKFTAKELDNETSYTYFGARYYDSDLSVWLSVDQMSDKYPGLSPYIYSANNPVVLKDPNGMWIDDIYINSQTNQLTVVPTNDDYDNIILDGKFIGASPKGLYKTFWELGGSPTNEVSIRYSNNVDKSKISFYTKAIIVDAMNKSNNKSILITSGNRTPEDQARIMKYYVDITGMEKQKKLYGPSGDKVLDYYPDQKAMTDEIYRLGPSRVSKHCDDFNTINVIDIAPSSVENGDEFRKAISSDSRVSKYIPPNIDKAHHIEILQ